MTRTNKPKRKVIGSLTGEVWTTRSAKIPRRKLKDGRTETGREIPEGHPEFEGEPKVEEAEEIEILIEVPKEEEPEDDGLEWKPAGQVEWNPEPIRIEEAPEPEPIRGRQAPRTTPKDHDKIEDLIMGMVACVDNNNYSTEDKVSMIAKLFEGTTDVRVETSQYVISSRVYGFLAMGVSIALLLKGGVSLSGGLFQNYRNMINQKVEQDPLEADPFGEEDGPN